MDALDFHAGTCECGGGVIQRHNAIRDWLAAWLERFTGYATSTEAWVPAWNRTLDEVDPETGEFKVAHARLDVAFFDGDGRRAYADVAVTSAGTTSAVNLTKRACTDGAAAADTVRSKRSKYPAARAPDTPMVPFVVEALGRLSPEAHGLLNATAPADKKVRSLVLRTAKQTLSVLVQTGLAELLLSAEPGRGRMAPAPAAALAA